MHPLPRARAILLLLSLGTLGLAQEPLLGAKLDGQGLGSLTFQGHELLSSPDIQVSVNGKAEARISITGLGDGRYRLVWPSVTAELAYHVEPSRLAYRFTFTPSGETPVDRIDVRVFTLAFPERPQGSQWFWGYGHSVEPGQPMVIAGDWGAGKIAVSVDGIADPTHPERTVALRLEGPNSPSTRYPVVYNLRFPTPLSHGGSATLEGSLRVAPSGTPTHEMAREPFAAFAERFPFVLDWPDRRPIGVIFLANSGQNWPTNPRGWFNDPKLDVTTEEGRADFRHRMLGLADRSIRILRDVGAQGMVFWDVEGGEMPHAITYLGDPRALPEHAPEMDAVADEFFKRFTDAGFKTGVTIRPSKIVTRPATGKPAHQQVDDPIADMSDKIRYARERWGATIFYMDTNVTWPIDTRPLEEDLTRGMWQGASSFIAAEAMVDLAKRHPDTLVFPEFPRFGYYSAVGVYGETHTGGRVATPEDVRAVYPEAVTVWKLGDVDVQVEWENLLEAVSAGDIHVFRAWFPDRANVFVQRLQEEKSYRTRLAERRRVGPFPGRIADPDPLVRYAALWPPQPSARERIPEWLAALETETDWILRHRLLLALGESGSPDVIPVLERFARDGTEQLAFAAMCGLGRLGGRGTEILLELARNKAPIVRRHALRALAFNAEASAIPTLLAIAQGENAEESALAVRALGARVTPAIEGEMIVLLSSDQPKRLVAAARVLGESRAREAVEPLVRLIERSVRDLRNNEVRVAAGQALESITGKRFGPYERFWRKALDEGRLAPAD